MSSFSISEAQADICSGALLAGLHRVKAQVWLHLLPPRTYVVTKADLVNGSRCNREPGEGFMI